MNDTEKILPAYVNAFKYAKRTTDLKKIMLYLEKRHLSLGICRYCDCNDLNFGDVHFRISYICPTPASIYARAFISDHKKKNRIIESLEYRVNYLKKLSKWNIK